METEAMERRLVVVKDLGGEKVGWAGEACGKF